MFLLSPSAPRFGFGAWAVLQYSEVVERTRGGGVRPARAVSFHPPRTQLRGRQRHCFHFTDEETEALRGAQPRAAPAAPLPNGRRGGAHSLSAPRGSLLEEGRSSPARGSVFCP